MKIVNYQITHPEEELCCDYCGGLMGIGDMVFYYLVDTSTLCCSIKCLKDNIGDIKMRHDELVF